MCHFQCVQFTVRLSLSFNLVADEVNIDNEHHQGTAHMQIDHCHISWMATCTAFRCRRQCVGYAMNVGYYYAVVVALTKICFVLLELIGLSPTRQNESQTSFQSQEPCVLPEHWMPCNVTGPLRKKNPQEFSTTNERLPSLHSVSDGDSAVSCAKLTKWFATCRGQG